jgi:site-specific recombinase
VRVQIIFKAIEVMRFFFLRMWAVWRRFRRGAPHNDARHLQYAPQVEALMRRANPFADWHERANWMIDVADWLRHERRYVVLGERSGRRFRYQRAGFLLDWLDGHRDIKRLAQTAIQKTLREAVGPEIFSSTGLPREPALVNELFEHAIKFVLPKPPAPQDLSSLFTAMFPDASDAEWLLGLDQRTLSRFYKLCADNGIAHNYAQQIDQALHYLVTMVVSVGISPNFRQRLEPKMPIQATPFMALQRELDKYLMLGVHDDAALRSVRMLIAVCNAQTDRLYDHLDEYGVSVGLVYHVERMRAQLTRIARLVDLRAASHAASGQMQALLAELISAHHRRSTVKGLITRSFSLFARKVVERNTDRGEHYIARNRSQYQATLKAACLGGIVIAVAALGKLTLDASGSPHFSDGVFVSLIYAAGFFTISSIGGMFAVRQAAVTAPVLATKMGMLQSAEQVRKLVAEIAALMRAQAAAVAGNLLSVAPIMLALSVAFGMLSGSTVMSQQEAYDRLHSLSLIGATPLFAIVTGALLWTSGLAAGLADNWFALRRLREALAHHRRLVFALGAKRAERFTAWVERHVAVVVNNLSLAVLLGMVPVVSHFFGIQVEIRHVTLSAAELSAIVATLGWHVVKLPGFWLALAGIAVTGLLNIGTALAFALGLAFRARDVPKRMRRLVFRTAIKQFILSPKRFLLSFAQEGEMKQPAGPLAKVPVEDANMHAQRKSRKDG